MAEVEDALRRSSPLLDEKPIKGGFRVGNVVVLKSGGPTMTVIRLYPSNIECVWFDDRECKHAVFNAREILKVAE